MKALRFYLSRALYQHLLFCCVIAVELPYYYNDYFTLKRTAYLPISIKIPAAIASMAIVMLIAGIGILTIAFA